MEKPFESRLIEGNLTPGVQKGWSLRRVAVLFLFRRQESGAGRPSSDARQKRGDNPLPKGHPHLLLARARKRKGRYEIKFFDVNGPKFLRIFLSQRLW